MKIRQLNDSYLIGMCVYATVVLSIALAPIGMLLETHVDIYYAIIGLMVMFGTTLILSLLFVPKVCGRGWISKHFELLVIMPEN